METPTLKLMAQPQAWRIFSARKLDPTFAKFAEKVFERDHYVCQYCGFQAHEYMDVVNRDNNYHNTQLSNMMTACCFCAQCLFIESIDFNDYGGGKIIYYPEMTQAELNGLCQVVFCAIANATNYRANAQNIYRDLKFRSGIVEETLGEGMSNPVRLGQMMIDAPLENREQVQETVLKDLRLLPSKTKFETQIKAWAATAGKELAA
jgi:intracellular multiplication protein IcmJ